MIRTWMDKPAPPLPSPVSKCARKICKAPNATWWNRSTHGWYCEACAKAINEMNGVELCTPAEKP